MGFIEESMGRENIEEVGDVVGPCAHLYYYDAIHSIWHGSVLVACHTVLLAGAKPVLTHQTAKSSAPSKSEGQVILTHAEWSVLRFRVRAVMEDTATKLSYSVTLAGSEKTPSGCITLPGTEDSWHVVGYSCNDQRQAPKTGTAAWANMKLLHKKEPIHVILGTGDQLYLDNVWHAPGVDDWVKIKDKAEMRATPLTQEQEFAVEEFYFFAYIRWIAGHPLGEFLSDIPMMNTWDDHDVFDGNGSYPEHLQNCPAFQQIIKCATRCYAAFQLHTTQGGSHEDGYFSAHNVPGFSWMTQLGPSLAVCAIDTRSARSRERIVPESLLKACIHRMQQLPASIKHLVFISAVPIEYPEVGLLENFMSAGAGENLFTKTGLYNSLMNEFGEPELLDDLLDHWGSSRHQAEKAELLNELRNFATKRDIRVSILSGDVHICGLAFVCSTEKYKDLATDPGFIPQLISSAIGYDPPANAVVGVLDRFAGVETREVYKEDPKLYGGMGMLFKEKKPSVSVRLANRNNFLELQVDKSRIVQGVPILKCTWHVRASTEKSDAPDLDPYVLEVPPILTGKDAVDDKVDTFQEELMRVLPGHGTFLRKVPCCGCCFAQCGL